MALPELLRHCEQSLDLFPRTPCAYFPEAGTIARATALNLGQPAVALPCFGEDETDFLIDRGWRHFGSFFFRNACPDCGRCRPLRIRTGHFRPSRSQRRVARQGTALVSRFLTPDEFAARHFAESLDLHNAFIAARFAAPPRDAEEFREEFFASPLPGLVHALFAPDGRLAGCGWLDCGRENLSSIYFSFHPDFAAFSPGTLSLLREIDWAAAHGRPRYHVGYWIEGHPAMHYKAALRPHELYDFAAGTWRENTDNRSSQETSSSP